MNRRGGIKRRVNRRGGIGKEEGEKEGGKERFTSQTKKLKKERKMCLCHKRKFLIPLNLCNLIM